MAGVTKAFFLIICLLSPSLSYAHHHGGRSISNDATVIANCPAAGDAKSSRVQELNILKRRIAAPSQADVDSQVTLAALVAPGDDAHRFDTTRAAAVEGYVADVKVGGVESVNCHTHDPEYRDTHIELTLDPLHDDDSKHVIVEVTPQWRAAMAAKGIDWSTATLRTILLGRWIKVTGWLLFDEEHASAAEDTAPGATHIWRATVWEIHPVTDILLLPHKP